MADESFNLVSRDGATWLECGAFADVPWLVHAFGTRRGGAFKPEPGKTSANSVRNSLPGIGLAQRRLFQALGAGRYSTAMLRQTHSAIIYCVSLGSGKSLRFQLAGNAAPASDSSPRIHEGDALITGHREILLGIRVADCVPVLLVDPERRVVAIVHAGWRGALARIVEKSAGEMCRVFGSRPENLMAAIGPSIRACCYEVGPEVVEAFCGVFPAGEQFFQKALPTPEEARMALRYQTLFSSQAPPGHRVEDALARVHLDLAAAARYQLEQAGVPRSRIYTADYCTACRTDLFYSYRKEGALAGRMLAVIGMRPDL